MIYALVALKLRADVSIVLIGSKEDDDQARRLASEANLSCYFMMGVMNVREVVAFLELAKVAFCLDSGPRHMANAAKIPVVFCRNMEFLKAEAGVYLESETDIAPDVERVSYRRGDPPLFDIEVAVDALLRHL